MVPGVPFVLQIMLEKQEDDGFRALKAFPGRFLSNKECEVAERYSEAACTNYRSLKHEIQTTIGSHPVECKLSPFPHITPEQRDRVD